MWFLGKIRESMENIPLELGRYVGKSEEENLSAKASLSNKLHSNILTPDKIPEFCLPPRLCRSLVAMERTAAEPHTVSQRLTSRDCGAVAFSVSPQVKQVEEMKLTKVAWRGKKPLPFSAEGYGLAGMYESPNTRRKESLFHSKSTGYTLDRNLPKPTTRVAIEQKKWKAPPIQSGLELGLPCKSLSETCSTESDTPSSNDSSPLGSPLLSRSCSGLSLSITAAWAEGPPGLQSASSGSLGLEGASSCSAVNPRGRRGAISPIPSTSLIKPCSSPPTVVNSLAPPVLFPLDVLHCQERLQREHVLSLPGGHGRVRLSAEHILSPSLLSMVVRVRVVSMEGLRDEEDPRALHCCLSLSLSPGKLQRQDSATIRNCRSPVFNEDFFFTELSPDSLGGLRLRLKVLDKASGLRRGTVLGIIITEPLAQLLPL